MSAPLSCQFGTCAGDKRDMIALVAGVVVLLMLAAQSAVSQEPQRASSGPIPPGSTDGPLHVADLLPYSSRNLVGSAIRSALIDRTVFGLNTRSGVRWIEYYNPDGTAIYKIAGKVFVGIWEVAGDHICFSYDNGALPTTYIYRMFENADRYYFMAVDSAGRERLSAIGIDVQSGRAEPLDRPVPIRHGRSIGALRRSMTCLSARNS